MHGAGGVDTLSSEKFEVDIIVEDIKSQSSIQEIICKHRWYPIKEKEPGKCCSQLPSASEFQLFLAVYT